MKYLRPLALVGLFLTFLGSNAFATTFNLWDTFPDFQGQNGFFADYNAGSGITPLTHVGLDNSGSFAFTINGQPLALPRIQRWSDGNIIMQPYYPGNVIYSFSPSQPILATISGQFTVDASGSEVSASIGTEAGGIYTELWHGDPILVTSASFSLIDVNLSPDISFFFAVTAGPPGTTDNSTFLQCVVDYQPVPLPSTLFLLGSGLLGLAGWRRFRKS